MRVKQFDVSDDSGKEVSAQAVILVRNQESVDISRIEYGSFAFDRKGRVIGLFPDCYEDIEICPDGTGELEPWLNFSRRPTSNNGNDYIGLFDLHAFKKSKSVSIEVTIPDAMNAFVSDKTLSSVSGNEFEFHWSMINKGCDNDGDMIVGVVGSLDFNDRLTKTKLCMQVILLDKNGKELQQAESQFKKVSKGINAFEATLWMSEEVLKNIDSVRLELNEFSEIDHSTLNSTSLCENYKGKTPAGTCNLEVYSDNESDKVAAIQFLRDEFGLKLTDAKRIVDGERPVFENDVDEVTAAFVAEVMSDLGLNSKEIKMNSDLLTKDQALDPSINPDGICKDLDGYFNENLWDRGYYFETKDGTWYEMYANETLKQQYEDLYDNGLEYLKSEEGIENFGEIGNFNSIMLEHWKEDNQITFFVPTDEDYYTFSEMEEILV